MYRPLTAVIAAVALVMLAGCDQEYPTTGYDVTVDLPTETPIDVPTTDPVEEPVEDPVEETAPCEYPPGPYGFDMVGQIAGPATWPGCIKAAAETSILDLADMAAFQCDPEVQSIGIFFATLS